MCSRAILVLKAESCEYHRMTLSGVQKRVDEKMMFLWAKTTRTATKHTLFGQKCWSWLVSRGTCIWYSHVLSIQSFTKKKQKVELKRQFIRYCSNTKFFLIFYFPRAFNLNINSILQKMIHMVYGDFVIQLHTAVTEQSAAAGRHFAL